MTSGSKPRRSETILAQRAAENTVLLDPSSGEYYTLDEVAGRIWDLADGSRTVQEIAAVISAEYAAPADVVENDTSELLHGLAEQALVRDDAPAQ